MALDRKYYEEELDSSKEDKKIYQYALITAVREFDEEMIDTLCVRIHNCNLHIKYSTKKIDELNAEGE